MTFDNIKSQRKNVFYDKNERINPLQMSELGIIR
jgi:hypothetical protein